jgi:N6-adenosine-specific RNA methylase IME4
MIRVMPKPKPARVLLADPPWQHNDRLGKRGAASRYRTMSAEQIAAYPLPPLAANCLLIMWRLSSMQEEALFVAQAWGFRVVSELVWCKQGRGGRPHFGLGRYVRASHETALIGVRGRVEVADKAVRSRFEAVVSEHSRKPDDVHRIAERLVPEGPWVELFARRTMPGWWCVGNELERLDATAVS